MILTPQGQFSTAPDDYIMAMKAPASLRGSGSPGVNVQIVNQSGTQLNVQRTVQIQRSDGGLDIKMIVNGVVKQAMASGEYDDAMMAMQMNNRGRSTYA